MTQHTDATTGGESGWRAWIHGTGHRTPTRCRISMPTAVALGLRHVPLVLSLDHSFDHSFDQPSPSGEETR